MGCSMLNKCIQFYLVESKTLWAPPFQSLPILARFIHFLKMASALVQHCSVEEAGVAKT